MLGSLHCYIAPVPSSMISGCHSSIKGRSHQCGVHQRRANVALQVPAPHPVQPTNTHSPNLPQPSLQCGSARQRYSALHCSAAPAAEAAAAPPASSPVTPIDPADVPLPDRLAAAGAQTGFDACVEQLVNMGFSPEDAQVAVAKAFGWSWSAHWRTEKVDEIPDPKQQQAVIDYLRGIGLEDAELRGKLLKVFPEALGSDVEKQLQANVTKLQQEYKLQGTVMTKALLRQPRILGFNVDCEGSCIGECSRCWVRF